MTDLPVLNLMENTISLIQKENTFQIFGLIMPMIFITELPVLKKAKNVIL